MGRLPGLRADAIIPFHSCSRYRRGLLRWPIRCFTAARPCRRAGGPGVLVAPLLTRRTGRRQPAGAGGAFKDLKWRSVGATRGGRVTRVLRRPAAALHVLFRRRRRRRVEDRGRGHHVDADQRRTDRPTGSIGSIDVAPSNPNDVWVGTGSAAIRSNVIIGRGVYKSLDAGKTWQFMGLKDSGQIGGIKVHPFEPRHRRGWPRSDCRLVRTKNAASTRRPTAARRGRRRCS